MKIIKWLDKHLEETALAILLVLICVSMIAQVIARYIFNDSMVWPEEFCRYCYIWTMFLSIACTIRHGTMLRVGVLADLLKSRLRMVLKVITFVAMIAAFGALFKQSFFTVGNIKNITQELSPAMRVPMWIMYLSAPIGYGLAILRSVEMLVLEVIGKQKQVSLKESIVQEAKSVVDSLHSEDAKPQETPAKKRMAVAGGKS